MARPGRTRLVLTVLSLLAAFAARADERPKITIIIDDLGYTLAAGRRAVTLPGPVVVAVLPRTPRGRALAEMAHQRGKEVLLHLPLQSVDAANVDEPGVITLDMSRTQFAAALAENIDAVPHAIGVNGHRGSLLTRHPGHMQWLMDDIAERGLIFVDSYTTHLSVALDIALENGISASRRDVFLDAEPRGDAIAREFERLKMHARRNGTAIGIGHPYPETLDFLERRLKDLEDDGFQLVGIRQLLDAGRRDPAATAELVGGC